MKAAKTTLIVLAAALLVLGSGTSAYAFHSGGAAECTGCHTMHSAPAAGSFLLQGTDQSSACLNCHQHAGDTGPTSFHISTAEADMPAGSAPKQRTPGGDFGWLKKNYTFVVRGTTTNENGQTHGHNIVAADYGYVVDSDNPTAPGGGTNAFPSDKLACTSCHDPHGKYRRLADGTIAKTGAAIIASGSYSSSPLPATGQAVGAYRLLAGLGYDRGDGNTFTKDPPSAVAPSTYNQTEATNQVRVAYGKGMSLWCAQCHPDMHTTSAPAGVLVHPVDQNLGSTIKGIYDSYRSSGNMTGTNADSFLSLAPFEENSTDYATLKLHASNTNAYLVGPGSTSQVSCLSCHRAHATGWTEMLRWNMEGEFITYVLDTSATTAAWPGTDTTPSKPQFARGRTSTEVAAAYYDRPVTTFGAYQRVLCNKCHAQD